MIKDIEISKISIKNPNKSQNGDFSAFELIDNENTAILILGDGVGSSPCDWKASKIGCEQFILEFLKNETLPINERIKVSIKKINSILLSEVGNCGGMKSTLSIIIWNFGKNKIYYINIGDSRIYEYKSNELTQVSIDETKTEILKKNGKPKLISGNVVVKNWVTNVIGSTNLKIKIYSKSDKNIEGVLLSSDGFHEITSHFNKGIIKVFNSVKLENSLINLQKELKGYQKDDMTVLLLRKNIQATDEENIIKEILDNKISINRSLREISLALQIGIIDGIKKKKTSKVKELLNFIEEKEFDLGRENLGILISLMVKEDYQERYIYQSLLKMMRLSKI